MIARCLLDRVNGVLDTLRKSPPFNVNPHPSTSIDKFDSTTSHIKLGPMLHSPNGRWRPGCS